MKLKKTKKFIWSLPLWAIPSHTDKQTVYKRVRLIHTRLGRMISSCLTWLFQTKRLRARLMIHIKIYFSVKESAQKTVFVFEFGERQIERAMPERERKREREGRTQREKAGTRESKQSEERYMSSASVAPANLLHLTTLCRAAGRVVSDVQPRLQDL